MRIELNLGTLAGQTLISGPNLQSATERTRISSVEGTYTLSEFTLTTDAGPIQFGLAHSDYTDTEIEEWVENTGDWDAGNKISEEIANRWIRKIGVFQTRDTGSSGSWSFRDGAMVKTKLNWLLTTGDTVKMWAHNMGSAALATTNPDLELEGHANLWRA